MTNLTPLSTIIALARAGALDHAWAQYCAAGYDRDDADPAALTVRGRLLKDHALRAEGEARRAYYLRSAEAYRQAAALQPATYPLINAATLSLLSGDRAQAEEIAREVLERIAAEPDEPETPYYRAATEAEALLLLGRREDARAALVAAVAAAPRAWEDHGSTLRQFVAIEAALGGDPVWLDLLRPPRSLAWLGLGENAKADPMHAHVAEFAAREHTAFAFGALVNGTDLAVAEALLAEGIELNLILPAARDALPLPLARVEAVLAAAESVMQVRPLDGAPDMRRASIARRIARGAALLNAERLMSETRELQVVAGDAGDEPKADDDPRLPELSLLAVSVGAGGDAGFEARLGEVGAAVAAAGPTVLPPRLDGDDILIGYAGPEAAAAAARAIHAALRGRMPLRIAAHHGLIPSVRDPFSGAIRPTEEGAAIVREVAGAIPPDTLCVSHDFAALLAGSAGADGINWIGELQAFDGGAAIGLYALATAIPSED
jgi:tetratricopeptide (TPR) repeat protein